MDIKKNINGEINDIKDNVYSYISKIFKRGNVDDVFNKDTVDENDIEKISYDFFEFKKNNILCENTLIDLEIFEGIGKDKKNTIFNYLDRTKTKMGKYLLKKIIENPLTDIKILNRRQSIIKKINTNKELKTNIISKLDIIKNKEKKILWLWKDLNDETEYLFNMVYFQNRFLKWLNKSEIAMKLYNYYVIIFSPIYGILSPIFIVLSPFIFLKFYFKTEINLGLYLKLIKIAFTGVGNLFKTDINSLKGNFTLSVANIASIVVWITFYIYSLFSNINSAINTNRIINIIHTKLNDISKYIKEGFTLLEITEKEILKESLLYECKVEKHFNILWNNIFETEPNIYSNKGLILKTYNIISENKHKLMSIIKYISNIDCFISIEKLLHEGYNYSTFLIDKKPILNITNLFNPVLGDKSIKNNLIVGQKNPLNVCITGPNAGGKSTFIKSLCISILLSQTITISPSTKFELTPISYIQTYINIPDCKGKESLYEAEMNRSLKYINKLKSLDKNKFSFVIMDEIFSSTNPEEGISGAYAIAKNLSNFNNNICILTTHYTYLTKLEYMGKFRNYKISIDRDNEKNIIYKYKLEKGVSNQFIALELLEKKGFDKNIVKDANDICKLLIQNNIRKKIPKLKKKLKNDKNTITDKIKENVKTDKIKENVKTDKIKENVKTDKIKENKIDKNKEKKK